MILIDPVSKLFVYCVSNSTLLFFFTLRRHFVDATDLQTKSQCIFEQVMELTAPLSGHFANERALLLSCLTPLLWNLYLNQFPWVTAK